MDKEQLQQQLDEIDYTTDALTHTIQYLETCLVEILKQKEEIKHELNMLNKKPIKVGFKSSKDRNEIQTTGEQPSSNSQEPT